MLQSFPSSGIFKKTHSSMHRRILSHRITYNSNFIGSKCAKLAHGNKKPKRLLATNINALAKELNKRGKKQIPRQSFVSESSISPRLRFNNTQREIQQKPASKNQTYKNLEAEIQYHILTKIALRVTQMIGENATVINKQFFHVFIKLTVPQSLIYGL